MSTDKIGIMDISIEDNNNNNNEKNNKVPFETALDKAGFGLYSWLLTSLNGLSIIAYACTLYSSTIIVSTSACDLNTTKEQQGLLMGSPLLAAVLGSVPWGYLADTQGRRRMLLASFFLATIFNSIASLSVNWVMLLVLQFIASFTASGQFIITMTLLSECVPLARRNLVVLVVASIFLMSQGIMALLAIPIMPLGFSIYLPALGIYWRPWRATMLIYGVPSIICFVCMLFMQESPKYTFIKKGEEEAIQILKRIHRINHFRSKEELQVKGLFLEDANTTRSENSESPFRELFRGKLLKYFIIMTVLAVFQQTGAFMVWLPTIVGQFMKTVKTGTGEGLTLCHLISKGEDKHDCSLNTSTLLVVFGVGLLQSLFNTLLALVVGKFGRRNMVIVIASVCGVSGIIVNLIPNAIASLAFFVVFLIGILLIGLYTAISVALFPTHLRALAISMTMTSGRIMLFIVIYVLRLLMENHCALSFYIFATVVACSAIVVSFLPDERYINKPKEIPENEDAVVTP